MDLICTTPEDTFAFGEELGRGLRAGDVVLFFGGLGAGKTLMTKGIMNALGFDVDEVNSPSFTLVNLYRAPAFDVYHIDLWRLDNSADPASAVGLDEILENRDAAVIIEWADRMSAASLPPHALSIHLDGDGEGPRSIRIEGTPTQFSQERFARRT
jgi:tRNA threonylcarbamoyladenosine biosynthesis protein TsaE